MKINNIKNLKIFASITEKCKDECGNSDGFYDGNWEIICIDFKNQTVRLFNGKVSIVKKFDEIKDILEINEL